jgi:hypothetical protein
VPTTLRRASKPGSAIERRIADLRRQVEDVLRLVRADGVEHPLGVGDVELDDSRARFQRFGQVLPLTAGEVVEHENLVAAGG